MMAMIAPFLVTMLTIWSAATTTNAQCFGPNDRIATHSKTASVDQVLDGFSHFTFELYKGVCAATQSTSATIRADNVFFSPVSIWSSLMATYLGARNATGVQLKSALGLEDMDAVSVANAYRMLRFAYGLRSANSNANYTFRMANKLCFRLDEPVRECIRDYFASELIRLDFAAHPEESRLFINRFVEEQTKDKIKNLIPQGYVDATTRLLIVNAAYFKGDWQYTFDDYLTEDSVFNTADGKKVPARMMNQQETYPYFRNSELQCAALEVPYSGGEMAMVLIVPDVGVPVENVMSRLSTDTLRTILGGMRPQLVSLALPKLRVEQTIDLEGILQDMGITDLFDGVRCDLSGFTGRRGISVSTVRHKAFVEVNEKGTEAAAATAVLSFRKGSLPREFRVDRPFIFLIRDVVMDATLFMGLIRNPTT